MDAVSFKGRTLRIAAIGAAMLGLIAGGIWGAQWANYRMHHASSDDARVDGEVITLSSRVGGWVTAMPVIEGDAIQAGQALVQIDDRETRLKRSTLAAQLESNRQQREAQEAEISQTDATTAGSLDAAQGKLAAAIASSESARRKLEQVQAEYRRAEDLANRRFVSPQALDVARTNQAAAEAELRRTEGEILATRGALASSQGERAKLKVLQAKLQANAADAAQIRSQIATLDAELDDRAIKSPQAGTVVMTFAREHEYVAAGQRLLMVHDPRKQWVEANIKETEIAQVQIGQPVDIRVSAYPDRIFHGKVSRVGGAATSKFALLPDPNPSGNFTHITQRLPVRIQLDAPEPALRPGMMVEVAIAHS